ncbi:MAG TPA: SIMPL domain-containing protein [Negativicutes bacterium]|nr:SIMPL domain-containing protein [Negativicutes bacterium]
MKMKKVFLLLMCAMFFAVPFAGAQEAPEPATISVQGTGKLEVVPDVAFIQLAVVTEAATVSAAQQENAVLANQVYDRLIAAGIEKDYIKTSQYSVIPLYTQDDGKANTLPVIRGYQIINGFTVTVNSARAGEIIDLALQAGVNQVQTVRFGKLDESGAKNAVLQMAVRDALAKAESMAAALGKQISRIRTVTESGVYVQFPELARYSKSADSAATPISPGYVQFNANVQLVVEMH